MENIMEENDEQVIEIELSDEGINEFIERLKELKESKEHIHFDLEEGHHLVIHHEDEESDDSEEESEER
jgi:hypothetical protein